MMPRYIAQSLAVGIASAALIVAQPVRAADERGAVAGMVLGATGEPVVGSFVKLRNSERRLTFMVISQDNGLFTAKDLPPGQYRSRVSAADSRAACRLLSPSWPARPP